MLAVYACLSAVYLLYLPHALPVLDDWTILEIFREARTAGVAGAAGFLGRLVDNTWWGQFRIFWASFVPVYALSWVAGFAGWPYFLLAWTAHCVTSVLLGRAISLLAADERAGFLAGAVFAVFPAASNNLLWPLGNYYWPPLFLMLWFYRSWKKLAVADPPGYGWKDAALALPVAFAGEQTLPALLLLMPLTALLFGSPAARGRLLRWSAAHLATLIVLLAAYVFLVNNVPVRGTFALRYTGGAWSLLPFVKTLAASLGLLPGVAEWSPRWRPELALMALLALAGAAFFWCGRRVRDGSPPPARLLKLFLWSAAAAALTYLPVALLPGVEWRYLHAPSLFLVPAGVALLSLLKGPAPVATALLAIAYCVSLTYFEIRQCWVPESREARSVLDAIAAARPFRAFDMLIFSGAPHATGPAPSFILGASWALRGALQHHAGAALELLGARELLVNDRGELALYNRDRTRRITRQDFPHLRPFVRGPDGRFHPKSVLAIPASEGRLEVIALPRFRGVVPAAPVTREELDRSGWSPDIYFAHRIGGPSPW